MGKRGRDDHDSGTEFVGVDEPVTAAAEGAAPAAAEGAASTATAITAAHLPTPPPPPPPADELTPWDLGTDTILPLLSPEDADAAAAAATAAPEDVFPLYSEMVSHALQMRREEAAREEEEDERIARELAEQFEREDEERQRQEEEDERLAREIAGGGRNVRRRTG